MGNSMKTVPTEARLLTDVILSMGSVPNEVVVDASDYLTHMDIIKYCQYTKNYILAALRG